MKAQLWLPLATFLGVSLPVLLLLQVFDQFAEHRVWIALGAGALATAFVQSRMKPRGDKE